MSEITKDGALGGVFHHHVSTDLRAIRAELSAKHFERREVLTAMLVAVLSGEHVMMLGLPGTGKSMICRDLVARFTGAKYFETLFSRQRQPEDLFGPLDLLKLSTTGEYHRLTEGYLPWADLAFGDEIGKLGPVVGHTMLTILNERKWHEVSKNGSVRDVPLSTMFTASNEVPTNESEDASALYDRLLIRVVVDYIGGKSDMAKLLAGAHSPTGLIQTHVDWDSMLLCIRELVPQVNIPGSVVDAVLEVRDRANAAGILVSDRRWRQSMRAMQAHAFLEDRTVLTLTDLRVLDWTMWSTPDQRGTVKKLWQEVADPLAKDLNRIRDEITEIGAGMRSRRGESQARRAGYGLEAGKKLKALARELDGLESQYVANAGDLAAAEPVHEVRAFWDTTRVEVQQLSLVED